MNYERLRENIIDDLTTELQGEDDFNRGVLSVKAKNVIKEAILRINYKKGTKLNDSQIAADLNDNYYSVLVDVTRYDYNAIGMEGESHHSANGIARTMVDRDSLWRGVHAYIQVL